MARPPRAACLAGVAAAALGAAGCGGGGAPPVGFSCTDRASVERALATAPGDVRLASGTLSDCLDARISDADLQSVGLVFHEVAEELRRRARGGDAAAATRLGFLVGATTRGAQGTNGVIAELDRRVSLVGGRYVDEAAPAGARALERGLAAGRAHG